MSPEPSLFEAQDDRHLPLAHRMRPQKLEDFLGQEHLLAVGKPLRDAIERGAVGSMVFWGPPGSGKTTLARLLASYTDRAFEQFSAVTQGVPRVREIIREAKERRDVEGRGTILFCDEIHRFNKAQQDAFLPCVEEGVITLIGATTENPSFELNSALLSRLRVFVLEPIGSRHIETIITRSIERWCSDFGTSFVLATDATDLLVRHADGDARRALNATEAVLDHVASLSPPPPPPPAPSNSITADTVEAVLERRVARYDKGGEEHFNIISALHKAVRGSDVEGALYWLARMIDGGEDPLYIARRVVRMASEDIGLADPRALSVALAAKDAFHFLGQPEGELAIAEAVIYCATALKSNRVYEAWSRAQTAAREHPAEPVPLHIRNAPTGLMKDLDYGKGYRYDHAEDGFAAGQEYLPEVLRDAKWYEPTDRGYEKTLSERLQWWTKLKADLKAQQTQK
ncbi:MAG: replication-associated recombination protein A [Gemmatimonadetes bacterium]|nr:replication-associated recombination protein A [Gemmatimonadota bacterium]